MNPLADIPTTWLETCLAVLALDPNTAGDEGGGIGQPCGLMRPEFGPGVCGLACAVCEATWAGFAGEACPWCTASAQRQQEHQAALVLQPPDTARDDTTHETRMLAWGQRMKRAVDAGIITTDQARRAWRRATRKAVA